MDVLVKCSQCLQELHDTEVVHRDVKPENFLLSTNGDYKCGRVVVCDFGLSRSLPESCFGSGSGNTKRIRDAILKNAIKEDPASLVIKNQVSKVLIKR